MTAPPLVGVFRSDDLESFLRIARVPPSMSRRTRDESEWVGLTSCGRPDYVTSCDVGSCCASGASCAPLYDVLCLVDDWPYFLLWRYRSKLCPRGTKPGRRSFLNETADSIRKSASGSRSWRLWGFPRERQVLSGMPRSNLQATRQLGRADQSIAEILASASRRACVPLRAYPCASTAR